MKVWLPQSMRGQMPSILVAKSLGHELMQIIRKKMSY